MSQQDAAAAGHIRQVGESVGEDSPLHESACAIDSSVCHEKGVHDLQLGRTDPDPLRRHSNGPALNPFHPHSLKP